jgi:hypothetical protein
MVSSKTFFVLGAAETFSPDVSRGVGREMVEGPVDPANAAGSRLQARYEAGIKPVSKNPPGRTGGFWNRLKS